MKNKIVRVLLIIVITLIVIDQVSKILVSNFLKEPVGNEPAAPASQPAKKGGTARRAHS